VSANQAPHLTPTGPPVHSLPASAFIEYLRELNGTPETTLKSAYMQVLLPTLRADFALSETYLCQARPPLQCAISAFGGLQDATVSREGLRAWAQHTNREFSLRMFQGAHFFLQSAQAQIVDAIARTLLPQNGGKRTN
jgi:medium-chain acyl-[acyl-carrier-protein] hydrolase